MTRRPSLPLVLKQLFLLVFASLWLTPLVSEAAPVQRGGRFALLISIEYYSGLPRLSGAQRDIELARNVAKAAGVPDNNIVVVRGRDADGDTIRRALNDLALRLAPADRVLVYFSGLGMLRNDPDRPGGCEEAFVAADGEPLGYGELAMQMIPIAERADKTVVVFDTCMTHKNSTRCLSAPVGSACRADSSRWRSFTAEIRKAGVPATNIATIHTGRPVRPAVNDAVVPVGHCLLDDATDLDRSGALSIGEISYCVQQVLGSDNGQFTLNGNSAFVPFMRPNEARGSIVRFFDDIAAGRDGRKQVLLDNVRPATPGNGPSISLRASAVGYLYLIASDGDQAARLIYPSIADGSNRISAGSTFTYPRSGSHSELHAGSTLLAILADNERDLSQFPAAPGKSFNADGDTRKALFDFATTSRRAASAPCQTDGKDRNLALWRACSDAYGAASVVITPK